MIHNPLSRKWMFQTKISNPWTIKTLWLNDNGDHLSNTRPENVLHSPPLSEGEGLACRVLQVLFYLNTSTTSLPAHLLTCECALTYLLSAHTHAPLYDYVHTFLPDCDHRPPVDPGQVSGPGPLGGAPLLTHRGSQVVRNQQSKNNKISREIVVRNQYLTNLWFFPGKLWWCGQTPARNGVCILTGGFPIQFFKG